MHHSQSRGWRRYAVGIALLTEAIAPAYGCQLLQFAQFHVEMQGNTPLVDAAINGQRVSFIVDSGSAHTLLTRPAAEALHLKITPIHTYTSYGVGGGDNVGEVKVQDFTLGDYTVHGLRLNATSNMELTAGVVGLLGGDLLARADVEFDLAEGAVRMFDPKECSGDQVVYWRQPYSVLPIATTLRDTTHLRAYVDLNGRRTQAMFDTGASISLVTTHAAAAAGVKIESPGVSADGQVHGLGNAAVTAYSAVFPTLTLGDESIKNARLKIADIMGWRKEVAIGSHIATAVMDDLDPQMLLGADFFLSHRVYVARSQGLIYFSYLGGPIFADPRMHQPAPPDNAPPVTTPAGADPH
jgi:predicted aspartyl protease